MLSFSFLVVVQTFIEASRGMYLVPIVFGVRDLFTRAAVAWDVRPHDPNRRGFFNKLTYNKSWWVTMLRE